VAIDAQVGHCGETDEAQVFQTGHRTA
jgi:hypothetical protein